MSRPFTGYVFISYSRKDSEVMRRIVRHLRAQGIRAWVDDESLVPGTPVWEYEIERAIIGAFAVVVVLSPDAKSSEWVLREITLADEYEKRVFPVIVVGRNVDSIPFRLVTRQFADIRQNEPQGLQGLSDAITSYWDLLTRLEEERNAAEQALRLNAERKAQEESEHLAKQKAEEEKLLKAEVDAAKKAKEEADRIARQKAEEQRLARARLEAERKSKEETSEPRRSEYIFDQTPDPKATVSKPALPYPSILLWGLIGVLVVIVGAWGIWYLVDGPPVTPVPQVGTSEPEIPLTEEAAIPFSGKSLVAPSCDYEGFFRSIEATDRHTVTFNLCQPDPAFLSKLAITVFAIYPEEWIENTISAGSRTNEAYEHPIGTGPYRVNTWQRADSITFTANPDYWGDAPAANTLVFRWASESSQRLTALQSGTADGIDNVSAEDYVSVISNDELRLQVRPSLSVFYIGINNGFPPFDDPRVRKAIAMGIDRQRLIDNFYPPRTEMASHFTPCIVPNGCVGDEWYPFDPEAALALLAEAGYPDGFSSRLYYRDVVRFYLPQAQNVALDIQRQLLSNLNINVELVVMESGAFVTAMRDGQLDGLHLFGWTSDYAHITGFLDNHFTNNNVQFGNASLTYANAITNGSRLTDITSARPFYVEANNAIRESVPMIPVVHPAALLAYRADVANQQASPFYQERFALMDPDGRDTLVWIQDTEPASLFCADVADIASLRACAQVMETLYSHQINSAEVEPGLAESCTPNEDLTVWVCQLRQGVLFHDGTTFDANDVVTTFTMGLDASSPLHVGNQNLWDYYDFIWGIMNEPQ